MNTVKSIEDDYSPALDTLQRRETINLRLAKLARAASSEKLSAAFNVRRKPGGQIERIDQIIGNGESNLKIKRMKCGCGRIDRRGQ